MDDYLTSAAFFVPRTDPVDLVLIEQQPTSTRFGQKAENRAHDGSAAAEPGSQQPQAKGGGVPQVRMFGISLTMRKTLMTMFPQAHMAEFVSAKLKLQLLSDETKALAKAAETSAKRKRIHKAATVQIVQEQAALPTDQGAKRDDLADCWLQARAWVHVRYAARMAAQERVHKKEAAVALKRAAAAAAAKAPAPRGKNRKPATQPAPQPATQPATQPANQPVTQPATQTATRTVTRTATQAKQERAAMKNQRARHFKNVLSFRNVSQPPPSLEPNLGRVPVNTNQ